MAAAHVINVDLARVFDAPEKGKFLRVMAWGDAVEVVRVTAEHVEVKLFTFEETDEGFTPVATSGFIVPPAGVKPSTVVLPKTDDRVLRVNFVDVQQGDGAVIETPDGKVILIDGGDNVSCSPATWPPAFAGPARPAPRRSTASSSRTATPTTSRG